MTNSVELLIALEKAIDEYSLQLILNCLAQVCLEKAKAMRTSKLPDVYQLELARKLEIDASTLVRTTLLSERSSND